MNELLYALLGFVAALGGAILLERYKEARKRRSSIRAVEWQINALVEACEWAVKSKMWDSLGVECVATFITQAFQTQPAMVIAPISDKARRALWSTYADACGTLALIQMHRTQVEKNLPRTALAAGNYEGVIQRSREALVLLENARRWLRFTG